MSEKEFKNNRPKSDEKDLEGLVQNFSQKLEPAAKKVKKQLEKFQDNIKEVQKMVNIPRPR